MIHGKVQRLCTGCLLSERKCEICEKWFTPRKGLQKTCSLDCSVQLRRKRSREGAARRYEPRAPRSPTTCEGCSKLIPAPKTGLLKRWCDLCWNNKESERARKRIAVRRCYKCNTALPEASRRPGKAVCIDCRVDPRISRPASDWRRRLRRYGITQGEYDDLFRRQNGCCRGCSTTSPGKKGWQIDHCHGSGKVRAIMCGGCNSSLAHAKENPTTLRRLADFIEQFREDKDIV